MSSTKLESDKNCKGPFSTPASCKPDVPYKKWWLHNHELIYTQEPKVTSTAKFLDQTGFSAIIVDEQRKVLDSYVKFEHHSGVQDLNAIIGDDLKKVAEKNHEFSVADTYTIDSDFDISQVSQCSKNICSDLDSCWIGGDKTDPWWRTSDRSDVPSVVTYKSLEHIQSCDSPWSRSSGDLTSDSPSSCNGFSVIKPNLSLTQKVCTPDVSRVQILEALCHSQTRAREAEKLAQQACDEKEEITKLYFRQASHLFAYRQWVEILHLHTLLQTSLAHFPVLSPKKSREWTRKKESRKPETNMNKWFVAFAVGLGIVSAGLLLGWTIGWLFHTL